jgi:hypothetical protein
VCVADATRVRHASTAGSARYANNCSTCRRSSPKSLSTGSARSPR